MENRFYLDLNRNGAGRPQRLGDECGQSARHHASGCRDQSSKWATRNGLACCSIPDQPYGPNNPFVARYAFIAVPIGNALDLNAIYNQALTTDRCGQNAFRESVSVGPASTAFSAIKASVRGKSTWPRFWRI